MLLPLESLIPNPEQPRIQFNTGSLEELAQSIIQNGVIVPVVVEGPHRGKKGKADFYIIHDGERRWRAARLAGLSEIPVTLVAPVNHDGQDLLIRALVANIQRADLSPIEEAKSFKRLKDSMGLSNTQIALRLGVGPSRVALRLNLLEFEPEIQQLIDEDRLSHDPRLVAALQTIPDSGDRVDMAKRLAERKASVPVAVEACKKLVTRRQSGAFDSKTEPGMFMAVKKGGSVNRAVWDAFASVGKTPPWPLVEISARDVCQKCSLREQASETVCGGCPLVEMLIGMIGQTK